MTEVVGWNHKTGNDVNVFLVSCLVFTFEIETTEIFIFDMLEHAGTVAPIKRGVVKPANWMARMSLTQQDLSKVC